MTEPPHVCLHAGLHLSVQQGPPATSSWRAHAYDPVTWARFLDPQDGQLCFPTVRYRSQE
jgi:hypothetical protein